MTQYSSDSEMIAAMSILMYEKSRCLCCSNIATPSSIDVEVIEVMSYSDLDDEHIN